MNEQAVDISPPSISNAPMQYAPDNELGVVLLFSDYARKHRIQVERIRAGYPDCIAYRSTAQGRKLLRIEFEYESKNFALHHHNAKKCDWIVCWKHNWAAVPRHLTVIELSRDYGLAFNVWLIAGNPGKCFRVNARGASQAGRVHSQSHAGDLILYCSCYNQTTWEDEIREVYVVGGPAKRASKCAGWTAPVRRVCRLKAPLHVRDFINHAVFGNSDIAYTDEDDNNPGFYSNNAVTSYWYYIRDLIIRRNPSLAKKLQKYCL